MNNTEIKKTEWEFLTDLQGNSITLYTVPFITAKLQYALNKYFAPALEKQLMLNLTDEQFQSIMGASGINTKSLKNIGDYKSIFLNEMKNKPLVELTKHDFDKAVEFCLLCVDKQKTLAELSRVEFDMIMIKENWDIQRPELMEGILNQYSFRFNADNNIPSGNMGEPEVLPIREEPKYNLRPRDDKARKEELIAKQKRRL
jgi:hypothetical protein